MTKILFPLLCLLTIHLTAQDITVQREDREEEIYLESYPLSTQPVLMPQSPLDLSLPWTQADIPADLYVMLEDEPTPVGPSSYYARIYGLTLQEQGIQGSWDSGAKNLTLNSYFSRNAGELATGFSSQYIPHQNLYFFQEIWYSRDNIIGIENIEYDNSIINLSLDHQWISLQEGVKQIAQGSLNYTFSDLPLSFGSAVEYSDVLKASNMKGNVSYLINQFELGVQVSKELEINGIPGVSGFLHMSKSTKEHLFFDIGFTPQNIPLFMKSNQSSWFSKLDVTLHDNNNDFYIGVKYDRYFQRGFCELSLLWDQRGIGRLTSSDEMVFVPGKSLSAEEDLSIQIKQSYLNLLGKQKYCNISEGQNVFALSMQMELLSDIFPVGMFGRLNNNFDIEYDELLSAHDHWNQTIGLKWSYNEALETSLSFVFEDQQWQSLQWWMSLRGVN